MINPFKKYRQFKQDIFSDTAEHLASDETKQKIIKKRKQLLIIDITKFIAFVVVCYVVISFLVLSMNTFASWIINLF